MKLLSYNWVKSYLTSEDIDEDKVNRSFGLGATYRGLLAEYIKRELELIEKKSRLESLADKPNRGELLIAYQAKREVLNNFLSYLIDSK